MPQDLIKSKPGQGVQILEGDGSAGKRALSGTDKCGRQGSSRKDWMPGRVIAKKPLIPANRPARAFGKIVGQFARGQLDHPRPDAGNAKAILVQRYKTEAAHETCIFTVPAETLGRSAANPALTADLLVGKMEITALYSNLSRP